MFGYLKKKVVLYYHSFWYKFHKEMLKEYEKAEPTELNRHAIRHHSTRTVHHWCRALGAY